MGLLRRRMRRRRRRAFVTGTVIGATVAGSKTNLQKETTTFCSKCGAAVGIGSKFCSKCGAPTE